MCIVFYFTLFMHAALNNYDWIQADRTLFLPLFQMPKEESAATLLQQWDTWIIRIHMIQPITYLLYFVVFEQIFSIYLRKYSVFWCYHVTVSSFNSIYRLHWLSDLIFCSKKFYIVQWDQFIKRITKRCPNCRECNVFKKETCHACKKIAS